MNIRRIYSGLIWLTCVGLLFGADISVLKSLINKTMDGYDKSLRPIRNQSLPIQVYVQFSIGAIVELEEVSEKFKVAGIVHMSWRDEFLTWNPAEYDGIEMLLLPSETVWHPALAVVNRFDAEIVYEELIPIRYVFNGTAMFNPVDIISSKCSIDTTFYPWDTQTCDIYFTFAGYLPTEVQLISPISYVLQKHYYEHGEWKLTKTRAHHGTVDNFPVIAVEITLERKPTFLIVNIMLPIIFMSILNLLVFILPVESGEKVSYAITVLLSIAVFLTLVGDNLPQISNPMSILSYYLLSVLSLSVFICFCTILSLHIYFKDNLIPVPRCLRSITLCCLCCKIKQSKPRRPHRNTRPLRTFNQFQFEHNCNSYSDGNTWDVTWRDVSAACDKFCFIICFLALIVITVIHIICMTQGVHICNQDTKFQRKLLDLI